MPGGRLFSSCTSDSRDSEKEGCAMTLSEVFALLAFLAAGGTLIVEIINTVFNITWKISHDRQNDDNKKSE